MTKPKWLCLEIADDPSCLIWKIGVPRNQQDLRQSRNVPFVVGAPASAYRGTVGHISWYSSEKMGCIKDFSTFNLQMVSKWFPLPSNLVNVDFRRRSKRILTHIWEYPLSFECLWSSKLEWFLWSLNSIEITSKKRWNLPQWRICFNWETRSIVAWFLVEA